MDKREIRFDGWKVDFDSGEISKHGNTHRLQDQPLQILDELVKRPGEVVTREQLIARLWPTGVVEFDSSLNSAVRKLRGALGDDAETPRYIETLPRKGYRFIAALEPEATIPSLPALPEQYVPTSFETGAVIGRRASDRREPVKRLAWGLGSILVAAVVGFIAWRMPGGWFESARAPENLPTIVVLPLVDMSVDQSEQPLCDGLTDELSNWLAHIPTLRVVARTSAFAFKDKNTDVREIGRALGATHVLEGSLRRSGDQLRITVQLITAATGLHLWSKSFDLPWPKHCTWSSLRMSPKPGRGASRRRWRLTSSIFSAERGRANAPRKTTSRRSNSSAVRSPRIRATPWRTWDSPKRCSTIWR
jgi:TolB-like protein/DNA-binding winged helix-turn-helix (wHTH) protein